MHGRLRDSLSADEGLLLHAYLGTSCGTKLAPKGHCCSCCPIILGGILRGKDQRGYLSPRKQIPRPGIIPDCVPGWHLWKMFNFLPSGLSYLLQFECHTDIFRCLEGRSIELAFARLSEHHSRRCKDMELSLERKSATNYQRLLLCASTAITSALAILTVTWYRRKRRRLRLKVGARLTKRSSILTCLWLI